MMLNDVNNVNDTIDTIDTIDAIDANSVNDRIVAKLVQSISLRSLLKLFDLCEREKGQVNQPGFLVLRYTR